MIALMIIAMAWAITSITYTIVIVSCLRAERRAEQRWTSLHPGMPLSRRPHG
jgi:hypothetical protein